MNWLRRLVQRRQLERDLADEIAAHLEERADELVAQGVSRDDPKRRAQREFGNVTAIEERGRDVWRWATIENFWADVRYGARQLRASPVFALATIVTLALGIGVNCAVFSVVDAVLLQPLPFPDPDRLVTVASKDLRGGAHPDSLSYPTFFDFRRDNQVFQSIASFRDSRVTLSGRGAPLSLEAEVVSHEFFQVLNVPMARGRGFLLSEERAGSHAAVVSHQLWTTVFGRDPALVGSVVTLDSEPFHVVGIAPFGFNFPIAPRQVHVWTTLARDATARTDQPVTEQRGARMLDAVARLKPGISIDQAQADMDVVAAALARQHPDENGNVASTYVRPALETIVGRARGPLTMLWGAVGLVLLIACANVANLLLARTTDREREYGVRLAIGGSRARVVQQLLVENLLLSLFGSAIGVLVAEAMLRLLVPFGAGRMPRIEDVGVDARLLWFAVALAVITALVCSLPPALRVRRVDFSGALHRQSRTSTELSTGGRSTLVVMQIAIGLVLLSGTGVLVAGFMRLMSRDLGFEPQQLLTFEVGLPGARFTAPERIAFTERLLERLRAEPGARRQTWRS